MKKYLNKLFLLTLVLTISACNNTQSISESVQESIVSQDITSLPSVESKNDSSVSTISSKSSSVAPIYKDNVLSNDNIQIDFSAQGARISKITFKNKQIAKDGFVVGRCANRIANGKFSIDGKEYNVTKNSGQHSLHGGGRQWQGPFATSNWTKVEQTASTITYTIHSDDGAEGYPGSMDMTVKYTLSENSELSIEYTATTTKDTLCNPTNHLFMSVNGNTSYNDIKLWIDADKYTPLNNQIPTGEIKDVNGTQFDYREEKAFDGSKNYDDNLVLNGEGYRKVASLIGTALGLKIDVYTDRPGLQLYKDGSGSICLETQMFPDAINHDNFESPILRAGDEFYSKTSYVFSEAK